MHGNQLFSLKTIVMVLEGRSDVFQLSIEIFLLHNYTFSYPEVLETLTDSFLYQSFAVIKCLYQRVVSMSKLSLAEIKNLLNWLARHKTALDLIIP